MLRGDFTLLAGAYADRPAYATAVVDQLVAGTRARVSSPVIADIGAGTGKLTQMLAARRLGGVAIEPNDAMRRKGEKLALPEFSWRSGSAEQTLLEHSSVDLVTMASAFHWADAARALEEFHRILRPGGLLALMWNPRDLARDSLQAAIERDIMAIAPGIQRRSSGAAVYTGGLEDLLLGQGLFRNLVALDAPHTEEMSVDRHLGAWRSVNDVRVQAGEDKFAKIITAIERHLAGCDRVTVHYRTRAWFVVKA